MKPPISETDWMKFYYYKDRSENLDLLWEGEEFIRSLAKKYKLKDPIKKMETWIMRKYGENFDPESMCPYTGMALFKQPVGGTSATGLTVPWRMAYWREDGELMRVRDLTPAEAEWIREEPEQFAADCTGFLKWLKKVRKKAEK